MAVKVLVVDAHHLLRIGICKAIADRFPDAIFVDAGTLGDALTALTTFKPSIVLMNADLPDTAGVEGVSRMLRAVGGAPILVLTESDARAHVVQVLGLSVAGYLSKGCSCEELATAVHRIISGHRYVSAVRALKRMNSCLSRKIIRNH